MSRLPEIPPSDAIVIGSGPNGLSAAIVLAQAGCRVTVLEASQQIGGGARSAELTLPGFTHDICSAVYPLAIGSPFFRTLPLHEHGLEWVHPEVPLAHPLDDGSVVLLERSLDITAEGLTPDGESYSKLMRPLAENWTQLAPELLRPLMRWPRHPWSLARLGVEGLRSAAGLARSHFRGARARALVAGLAAHSLLPLEKTASAAYGLMLGAAGHAAGWPIARGGSQCISEALASVLRSLGGNILAGYRVETLACLPPVRAILCEVGPKQLLRLAEDRLPPAYRTQLARYRYGLGAFKMDWALDGPIPWRNPECRRAGTVHVGGMMEEIAFSERSSWQGTAPERPFVLLSQPTLFDSTRAPAGKHTAWAYCHVPHASTAEMTTVIEQQIERFAPGFRKTILARSVRSPTQLEAYNPNLVGGDVNGGAGDLRQIFLRPTARAYATPVRGLYLCSASTPPGGGVHGMCGYYAAKLALQQMF